MAWGDKGLPLKNLVTRLFLPAWRGTKTHSYYTAISIFIAILSTRAPVFTILLNSPSWICRDQKGFGMAFIKKPFKRLAEGGSAAEADTYIDLGELTFDAEGGALGDPVEHLVKVAEVYRYEDVADLTTHVYNGNILLIDFKRLE